MLKREKSGKASPKSAAIDSSQLLALCQKMHESMSSLDKCIQVTQLKLTTLTYVRLMEEESKLENKSLKCFEQLIELCNLSQNVVQLLEQLHQKLSESAENSIQYQIASQQLMYITSEWYDNFTPKLNETFELAYRQNLIYQDNFAASNKETGRAKLKNANAQSDPDTDNIMRETNAIGDGLPERALDALLRLRESMRDNERLIATIATNIEYTRATIDTIHEALQSTKLNLNAGETNAIEALESLRESRYYEIGCYLLLISILVIICLVVLRLIGIL